MHHQPEGEDHGGDDHRGEGDSEDFIEGAEAVAAAVEVEEVAAGDLGDDRKRCEDDALGEGFGRRCGVVTQESCREDGDGPGACIPECLAAGADALTLEESRLGGGFAVGVVRRATLVRCHATHPHLWGYAPLARFDAIERSMRR